jgi:hypothetical protein
MSDRPAAARGSMLRGHLVAVTDYATQVLAVADAEARKLRHDPWELLSRAIQPVLWLVLFGEVMAQVRGLSSGTTPYLDFLAPGILAQSVVFVAIFYGISAIWERDLGVLHRYMVSPAPRSALVIGKALSASFRGLSQAVVIYLCAALMGVNLDFDPRRIVLVILFVALGAGLFSTFSLIIACIVKTRERFIHGDRAGPDDADLLRQQCNLSNQPHAGMAENCLIAQPAHLRGRWPSQPHAAWRGKHVRPRSRFCRLDHRGFGIRSDCDAHISSDDRVRAIPERF